MRNALIQLYQTTYVEVVYVISRCIHNTSVFVWMLLTGNVHVCTYCTAGDFWGELNFHGWQGVMRFSVPDISHYICIMTSMCIFKAFQRSVTQAWWGKTESHTSPLLQKRIYMHHTFMPRDIAHLSCTTKLHLGPWGITPAKYTIHMKNGMWDQGERPS